MFFFFRFNYNSFMNNQSEGPQMETTKTPAKYLIQRAARTRYSFGKVWTAAVMEGKITDTDKLVAHAVKLKAGRRSDLKKLRFSTLLAKVQAKLVA
jgi:hypothetical protein